MKEPFTAPQNATPIDISELKLPGIATYQALSNQEAESIFQAKMKYFSRKPFKNLELSEYFLKKVHRDMFEPVWGWAGRYRKTETNIGVKPYLIPTELLKLCNDYLYWVENCWSDLDIGIRLHHRLVSIHPFENGNGRHARFVSDLHFFIKNHPIPKWPVDIQDDAPLRSQYIQSLQQADGGNFGLLTAFVNHLLR